MGRSKEQILKEYMTYIDFWADFLGEDYEIVLHDVEDIENSIKYIRNSFSGRKIGGSLTDLGLRILKEKKYTDKEFYVNYTSKTLDGKVIRSATYFIKDDHGKLISMLCVNVDVSKAVFFNEYLQDVIKGQVQTPMKNKIDIFNDIHVSETLYDSIEEVAHDMINQVLSKLKIPVNRMTLDEKKEVIHELDEKGFFLIKRSVKVISQKLDLSETTVYRCISQK